MGQHGSVEFHQSLRRGKSSNELESSEKEKPQCQSFRNLGTSGFRGNWFSITINNWVVSSNVVWNWAGTEGEGSVQLSCFVLSNSLWPHGLQHALLPCPSLTSRACSNSCPLSWWCHPTLSSSVIPFSCLQFSSIRVFSNEKWRGRVNISISWSVFSTRNSTCLMHADSEIFWFERAAGHLQPPHLVN